MLLRMTERVNLVDLVVALAEAADLAVPDLAEHHIRVAYVAGELARVLGLSPARVQGVVVASMLHDCGAVATGERVELLNFDLPADQRHADAGYRLLRRYEPLAGAADIVRWHHLPWAHGAGAAVDGRAVPLEAHVIHVADRLDALLRMQSEAAPGRRRDLERLVAQRGGRFEPRCVDALVEIASSDAFWLDLGSRALPDHLARGLSPVLLELQGDLLLGVAHLFSELVDLRSRFTATHSRGVAAVAEHLARSEGFGEADCRRMRVAGYLHDLGKLAIPNEILDKPGRLTDEEFSTIRSHTYHTYRILQRMPQMREIAEWGAFHHERLDGSGYPFKNRGEELSLGSRIMAVADVFTAVTEDRPYRKGMSMERALRVLTSMADQRGLDPDIVAWVAGNLKETDAVRAAAQVDARRRTTELGALIASASGSQGG